MSTADEDTAKDLQCLRHQITFLERCVTTKMVYEGEYS